MRRRSITGPLILILIGVLFLTRNLWQDVPLFQWISLYWPFILIAWGVLRLIEVLVEASRSKPLPSGGLSGGEVALIILLCIIGSGMYAADRHGVRLAPFGTTSLEVFGEQYDYRTTSQKPAQSVTHWLATTFPIGEPASATQSTPAVSAAKSSWLFGGIWRSY